MDRRSFLGQMAVGGSAWVGGSGWVGSLGMTDSALRRVEGESSAEPPGRQRSTGIAEPAFRPLPLGSIQPRGWLLRQLQIQADGLTGHLDEFWPDVGQSQWFGGEAEGWERAPYWLDGVIPLAWGLDDQGLKEKATSYVEEILVRQRPDGWYGPVPREIGGRSYDPWAILLANKVLAQYHEATGDDRAFRAVEASLRALAGHLPANPLFNWGRYRWFEGLVSTFYVYERTGEAWLLELAALLRDQGTDYRALYAQEDVTSPTPRRGLWNWDKHVVNTGMAVKSGALSWRLDQSSGDRAFPGEMLTILDRYHGQVTGMFTGDECLAGKNPVQGTELCAVVELMYSLETLLSVFGDAEVGDRLEKVAFNALPATFTPDMWAHQYDQQVNQVQCTINPDHMWSTNGPESNIYGLEPNYGCCTSNMHQGWPKFCSHLFMQAPEGGLAVTAYAPSQARFRSRDVPVTVMADTEYPFREFVRLTVHPDRRLSFPLLLRVPVWARGATIRVDGGAPESMEPGSFHRVERVWDAEAKVEIRFPMRPRATVRYNHAVSVERGPLVYGLAMGEEWTRVNADEPHRELPHGDFEVRSNTPWNYGILLDPRDPEEALVFQERPIGDVPFSPEGAGIIARVRGRRLPGWEMRHGWAGETPRHIQTSDEPLEELRLIPYGCTNIRIAEFPRVEG